MQDLDADGDLDIGSTSSSVTGKFVARADAPVTLPGTSDANISEIKIGQFTFTYVGGGQQTSLNFITRKTAAGGNLFSAATWFRGRRVRRPHHQDVRRGRTAHHQLRPAATFDGNAAAAQPLQCQRFVGRSRQLVRRLAEPRLDGRNRHPRHVRHWLGQRKHDGHHRQRSHGRQHDLRPLSPIYTIQGPGTLALNGLGGITVVNAAQSAQINTRLALTGTQTWNVASGATLTIGDGTNGGFGSSTAALIKSGTGTLLIKTGSTGTGSTTINSGTVRIESATALGAPGGSGNAINAATLEIANVVLDKAFTLTSGRDDPGRRERRIEWHADGVDDEPDVSDAQHRPALRRHADPRERPQRSDRRQPNATINVAGGGTVVLTQPSDFGGTGR